jgi:hypothetical protein
MHPTNAKLMIAIGGLLLLLGCLFYFFSDKLQWIGHLPGDLRIEKENFKLYIPFTTMMLFSILFSILARWLRRLL